MNEDIPVETEAVASDDVPMDDTDSKGILLFLLNI